jgi:hypothetical protein
MKEIKISEIRYFNVLLHLDELFNQMLVGTTLGENSGNQRE